MYVYIYTKLNYATLSFLLLDRRYNASSLMSVSKYCHLARFLIVVTDIYYYLVFVQVLPSRMQSSPKTSLSLMAAGSGSAGWHRYRCLSKPLLP